MSNKSLKQSTEESVSSTVDRRQEGEAQHRELPMPVMQSGSSPAGTMQTMCMVAGRSLHTVVPPLSSESALIGLLHVWGRGQKKGDKKKGCETECKIWILLISCGFADRYDVPGIGPSSDYCCFI